jgi:hypothetical protein
MFTIRKVQLGIAFLLCFNFANAQNSTNYSDTIGGFKQSFGYGVANLIEIASNNSGYRPQVYFDYARINSKGFYYRASISFSYRRFEQGNLFQHELIPFNITIGGEKYFYKQRFFFVLGADLFYSMSVRKSNLSPFQSDDFGVGIAPVLGTGFCLRENLSLFAQYEPGFGVFRSFVGVGNRTQATLTPRFAPMRNLSFGLRHFF